MAQADVYALDPETEAKVRDAEKDLVTFHYAKPDKVGSEKGFIRLGRAGSIRGVVQVVKKDGGENNLHYHTNADSLWMVLKGRVRFYGADDKLLGEFGPQEGLITPRYFRYWFENAGEDDLELLQIGAFATPEVTSSGRTDCEPQRYDVHSGEHFSAEKQA